MAVELSTVPTERADAYEDAWSEMVHTWFNDGVWTAANGRARVTADGISGMEVKVGSAKLIIRGFHGQINTENNVVEVGTASATPRIDRIVGRLDRTVPATIFYDIVPGTPAAPGGTPVPPTLTNDSDTQYIKLAQVYVAAGAVTIQQADITDEREWASPRVSDPAGVVKQFVGSVAPAGYLLMIGQSVSSTTYPALAAVLGATGANFTIPDMREKFVRGAANSASPSGSGGADTVTLNGLHLPAHTHAISDPGHTHTAADPGHTHTINQSPHGHGISDPGHKHGVSGDTGNRIVVTAPSSLRLTTSGGGNEVSWTSMDNAQTGVSVQGANANVSNASAMTGIAIGNSQTGITVQSAGSSSPFSILPSYRTMNFIIKAH